MKSTQLHPGFGIIEIIVAMGLFAIIAVTAITTTIGSFSTNRLSSETDTASLLAQEGIEAALSLKRQGWSSPFLTTDCSAGCGVTAGGGSWSWSGANNVIGDYTRTITVSSVNRNGSNVIVTSGGSDDPNTKKITSSVSWNFSPGRSNTATVVKYVTNYVKSIIGDWSNPSQQSSLNLSGNRNGFKVAVSGNYAFVTQSGSSPDFYVVNLTNLASPSVADSLSLAGTLYDVEVVGNYAYVTSSDNSQELIIINISNPNNVFQVGSYDAPGSADGYAVEIVGTTAYLVQTNSGSDEFISINISNPASPSYRDSINMSNTCNEIVVIGNYAYVASDDDSQELKIVNVSNPNNVFQVGSYNASGNNNAESITGAGNYLYLGREGSGQVLSFSLTNPTNPSLLDTYTATDDVRDMDLGNNDSYLFLATDDNGQELQILDVSNPSSMSLLGTLNNGNNDLNGVDYDATLDRAIVVGDSNSAEVQVIQPG